MNPYDFYITPDDYEKAAKFGIRAPLLEARIRTLGWTKERAVNTPPKRRKNLKEWRKVAEQNGIPYHVFRTRIASKGWTEERAATQRVTTLADRRAIMAKAKEKQIRFNSKIIEQANRNGIDYQTFYMRVRRGWDEERAASEALWTKSQQGTATVEKLKRTMPNW